VWSAVDPQEWHCSSPILRALKTPHPRHIPSPKPSHNPMLRQVVFVIRRLTTELSTALLCVRSKVRMTTLRYMLV